MVVFLLLLCLLSSCQSWRVNRKNAVEAFNRGNEAREEGALNDAVEFYNDALFFDPDMVAASFNLALALEELGNYQEAEDLLLDLQSQDPFNLRIFHALAYIKRQSGDIQGALNYYRGALEIFEADTPSLKGVVSIHRELKQMEQALEYQNFLIFLDDSAENRYELAAIYFDKEDFQAALEEYRLAFRLGTPDADNLSDAAEIAEKLELFDESLAYYLQASKSAGEQKARILFNIARLRLNSLFRYAEGFQSLQDSLNSGFKDEKALEELKSNAPEAILPAIVKIIKNHLEI